MGLLQALNLPAPGRPQAAATPLALAIQKPDAPFAPGEPQGLRVMAIMPVGKPQDYTHKVTWSSSNEGIVKMLPGGIAQVGPASGPVKITAVAPGGKPRDSIDLTVRAKLKDVVLTPKDPLVESGKNEVMTATAVYEDGSTEVVTPWLDWSTDKPGVVDFRSNGGVWFGKGAGTARVAATDRRTQITGFTKATVFAAGKGPKLVDIAIEPLNPEIKHGEPVQFRAFGIYADRSRHEITEHVTWKSTRPEVLVIDEDFGLARPRLLSGSSLVSAVDTAANRGQSTTVFVDFPGIVRIEVTPKDIRIDRGEVAELTVMATLKGGWQMPVNEFVQWTLADPDIAVVDPGGARLTGVKIGDTQIEAFEPASAQPSTFHVTVAPPKMTAITVFPPSQTIRVGEEIVFIALGRFADLTTGNLGRPVWTTSDRTVVDVTPLGVATAKATGDVVIHIQDASTGVMGHAEVKVVP